MHLGARLAYARKLAGFTGPQAAERSGIGTSSISEFENGKREPSLSQLNKLASTYARSVSFFLEDAPPPKERVLWRMRPEQGAEAIETRFLRLCEQYANLEMWTDRCSSVALPKPSATAAAFSYSKAESLAKKVRDELQLGDRPGRSLLWVLEEICQVKVFHLSFNPTGTAASACSERFGMGVLLNARNIAWRRTFDLAHELFHLLTWEIFHSDGSDDIVANEWEEKLATCFASNLLMPTEAVRTALEDCRHDGRFKIESLFTIARQFDVSVEALLWRMHFLYNRKEQDTKSDIEKAKSYQSLHEEREDIQPPEVPARYKALAIHALNLGEMSIGRFAEYMGITRQEAMRFAEQEATDEQEVQVASA